MDRMKTMKDFFTDLRKRNTFEWDRDQEITAVKPGHLEMVFHTREGRHANFRGDLHGATYVGFSDTLMGTSCFTLGKAVVTLDISGNYIKAAKAGTDIRGVANVEHNGSHTMVVTCRMYNELGEVVYMGRGTFYVKEPFALPDLPF
ncbi:MAG: PaaI family thioesterase [Veillonellaceae bacterium]|nr:PaaI family thioesterase [Veillonellaceae bacterium]